MAPQDSNLCFHSYDQENFDGGIPTITSSAIRIPASQIFIEQCPNSEWADYQNENLHERDILVFDDVVSSSRTIEEFAKVESTGARRNYEIIDGPFVPVNPDKELLLFKFIFNAPDIRACMRSNIVAA